MSAWLKQAAVMAAGLFLLNTARAATYYLNDGATNGDVYCTVVGSDANDGNAPGTPMLTLTNLLAVKDLNAGDTVFIDTGGYSNYTVFVGSNDAGSAGTYVTFQGSTNFAAGGASFVITNAAADVNVFYVYQAPFVAVSNLTFVGSGEGNAAGLQIRYSPNCRAVGCVARGTTSGSHGFYFRDGSPNGELIQCVSVGHSYRAAKVSSSTNVTIQNCVFWGGGPVSFENTSQGCSISNSVLNSSSGEVLYRPDTVFGDYNVYYPASGGYIANDGSRYFANLSDYQTAFTQDLHSSVFDPQFASTTNYDFHPLSATGRYLRGTGWVKDAVTSGLIDMGSPRTAYANEPAPNGSRVDVGCFGNTAEASLSPTNPRLRALTFNDGGTVAGTGNVYWAAVNLPAGARVRVEYSLDNGGAWAVVQTNVPATNEVVQWNTSTNPSSARGRWRVVYESDTNVADEVDRMFSVHNTNLFFYVNDDLSDGDMYTSALGSSNNTGISASSPKRHLQEILDSYDLSPGDTVYVDTGSYVLTNTAVTVGLEDSGEAGNYLVIQGSTNWAYGGSVIEVVSAAAFQNALYIRRAPHVRLADLTLKGGGVAGAALYVHNSPSNQCYRLTCEQSGGYGVYFNEASGGGRMQNCLIFQNSDYAIRANVATNVALENCVTWGLLGVQVTSSGLISLTNCIVRSSGGSGYALRRDTGGAIASDYNLYVVQSGAAIAYVGGVAYPTLASYQEVSTSDWHSSVGDPLFADTAATNFHLKSVNGRWTPGGFANDAVHSPAIDLGSPASDYTSETSPNGARVNAGCYGNTPQASRSRTNAWLQTLSFNDGGTLDVPGDAVYWNSGNLTGGATVRIELSRDAGSTWYVVATNLLASSGSYTWVNTNYLSSRYARWRVVYESDTNVYAATAQTNFTFRNGIFSYYINDGSILDDVRCTAPGDDSNLGTDGGTPKATLRSLFLTHDIQPDDVIYVDTGWYQWSLPQTFSVLESGSAGHYVTVQGSTNLLAGGTYIDGRYAGTVFDVSGAQYVQIRDVTVSNASVAVRLYNASGSRVRGLLTWDVNEGISVENSDGVIIERCSLVGCESNAVASSASAVLFENNVLWENVIGVRAAGGRVASSNNVIVASGPQAYAYHAASATNICGDYNDLYAESNAVVGRVLELGRNQDTLAAWVGDTTQEVHSVSVEPRFADPASADFHLKSEASQGRYQPGVGWVRDSETSFLIDGGDPAAAFSNEPPFSGNRANIGLYGNTAEASKGITNARLHAASLRDGGWVRGTGTLHWVALGDATGHTVKIEYSSNGGQSWSVLTSGAPAAAEIYAWDTTRTNNTPAGLWRIVSLADPGVQDETTNFFAVRNGSLMVYVNNGATNGDMYTTAAGAATNWIASTNRPLNSLATALDRFDLEPGDMLYVDTGAYTNTANPRVSRLDGGSSNSPVRIAGSTAESAGGTVLYRSSQAAGSYGLHLDFVGWVAVSNLSVRRAYSGVCADSCVGVQMDRVRAVDHASNGVELITSSGVQLSRVVSAENDGRGLYAWVCDPVTVLQSVIWSNSEGAVFFNGGRLEVSNSVLGSTSGGSYVYDFVSNAVVKTDFNDVLAEDPAQVSRQGAVVGKSLIRWQQSTTNDLHSLSHNPLFADPGALDFHPRSRLGRYSVAVTNFVTTDTNISPIVDTGDPAANYALEPTPNGGRLNIGLYGNTAQASKGETNAWLLALTLNDGGTVRGTNVLYWTVGGATTSHLVRVDFYDGITWTNIASNLQALAGSVIWTSTLFRSTALGRWRVADQSTPSVFDESDSLFSLNNESLSYYVNDGVTNGDIYTAQPGSLTNNGLSFDSPLPSMEEVLRRYDLGEGDRILVDTGTYPLTNAITIGYFEGSDTNYLVIQGSTNYAAGGSVFMATNSGGALYVYQSRGIQFEHLTFVGAVNGVRLMNVTNCLFERVGVRGGDVGYHVQSSGETKFRHCWAADVRSNGLVNAAASGTVWESSVLWNNGWSNGAAVGLVQPLYLSDPPRGSLAVSNSVIVVSASNAYAFTVEFGVLVSDYNDIFLTNRAYAALVAGSPFPAIYDSVRRWARDTTNDVHSLSSDPLFHNPAAGDFHPRSQGGRFDPSSGVFVADSSTSPLIDAGDPARPVPLETEPNGARLNLGMFGNSTEASRTPTNASITVITLNDGGRFEGTNTLLWVGRGDATTHTVRLRYSPNAGATWTNLATGLLASAGAYLWDSTTFTSTLAGYWEIQSEIDPAVQDRSDQTFALRNRSFSFYVNDESPAGDRYTAGIGDVTNSGLTANQPKLTLQAVLDAWDLEPGDVVYVDTGIYSNAPVLRQLDGGRVGDTNRTLIQGSTNYADGGTVFVNTNGPAITVSVAGAYEVRDLSIRDSLKGVLVDRAEGCRFEWVSVAGGEVGFFVEASRNTHCRHSVARNAGGYGIFSASSSNTIWSSGVLWSNRIAIRQLLSTNYPGSEISSLGVSNSIFGVFAPTGLAYWVDVGTVVGDYNDFLVSSNAYVAQVPNTNGQVPRLFENVSRLGRDYGIERHSLSHDPGFADPAHADFHLKSSAGRYQISTGTFVTDAVSSVLLDAGNPAHAFADEPSPNGDRLNIGLYGHSAYASMTPTDAVLTAVALNDGGRAEGGSYPLYWIAGGPVTAQTVRLEFSADGGVTWTNIATNIPGSTTTYSWDTTLFSSTLQGLWKVTWEGSPAVYDVCDHRFSVRNTAFTFYVNDAATNGDVYCQVAGHVTNSGLSAVQPKDSLQGLLGAWDVESGDRVYVDTGGYSNSAEVLFTQLDSAGGSNDARVVIQGSTNYAMGGTVLDRLNSGDDGIRFFGAIGVELRDVRLRRASAGISLYGSEACVLEWVRSEGGGVGFNLEETDNIRMRHCAAVGAAGAGLQCVKAESTEWGNGLLWSNVYGLSLSRSSLDFSNNVVWASAYGSYAFYLDRSTFQSDYNGLFLTNAARAAYRTASPKPEIWENVSLWTREIGSDRHSLSVDPLFFNPHAGDFHLQSAAGRYDPSTGTFVNDPVTSPLVDAGGPSADSTNEPAPSGARLNIGLYGGSAQASKTPTNAALTVISLSDGGRAESVYPLYWTARGAATGHTVRLEFSSDGGIASWQSIVGGLDANMGLYVWDTRDYTSTVLGVWRVVSEVDTNVQDRSDQLFAVRNVPLKFYVNDASTNGDVYCAAAGNAVNRGVSPALPDDSVQDVLDMWDLEPGDQVFVDSGSYLLTAGIRIDRFDAWNQPTNVAAMLADTRTNRVVIQGSTNDAAGGSVLTRVGGGYGIEIDGAVGVELRNLRLRGASVGVYAHNEAGYGAMEWIRCENGVYGFSLDGADYFEMAHCAAVGNSQRGLSSYYSDGTIWRNGVIWSNLWGAYLDRGSLHIENSIIGVFGSESFGHYQILGTRTSDYNNIYLQEGGLAAGVLADGIGGITTRYENVYFWSRASGQDAHTLTFDPAFANVGAGDYHLRTAAPTGRYDSVLRVWTNDAEISRLIDAGNPATACTNEPLPDGDRVDIGYYGGSTEASRTPTNGWLSVITLNDGGSVQGTITLRWVAGGDATGKLVHLSFSSVGGINWTNIATNMAASAGQCEWDTAGFGRSAAGLWRVMGTSDSNEFDICNGYIVIRTNTGGGLSSIPYYVNDDSTNGDVYCTAVGNATNLGIVPYAPASSLQSIIDTFKLEPVDIVYVDTGLYPLSQDLTIGDLDSGNATNHVTIQGSTNYADGGSVLDRQIPGGGTRGILLQTATGIELKDLIVRNAHVGVQMNLSQDCVLSRVRTEGNTLDGFGLQQSHRFAFDHCVAFGNGTATNGAGVYSDRSDLTWENGAIANNFFAVNLEQSGTNEFRHSVLQASGNGRRIFNLDVTTPGSAVRSDYNDLLHEDTALIAEMDKAVGGSDLYSYMVNWQKERQQDIHSLSHDPQFVDGDNGDFHLRSRAGRFLDSGALTNDLITSPLIDSGDPSSTAWTNEPAPNGARVNMGVYGGSGRDSLSETNPWVTAVSFNDGGIASGTNILRWVAGAMTNGSLLRLEQSPNNGIDWYVIASNILASSTGYAWDVSSLPVGTLYKWRVLSQDTLTATDTVDSAFTIKNAALTIYVNDGDTTNDVYCSAIGNPLNSGLSPASPLDSPLTALQKFILTAGDTVKIDTGIYYLTNAVAIRELRGESNLSIQVVGSTNRALGSTLYMLGGAEPVLQIDRSTYIDVSHLRLVAGSIGLNVDDVSGCRFEWIEAYMNTNAGIALYDADSCFLQHCASWSNRWGLTVGGASSAEWLNGTLWGNLKAGAQVNQGTFAIYDSILHSAASNSYLYEVGAASLYADYNVLHRAEAAGLARNSHILEDYNTLQEWIVSRGIDSHSVLIDPLLADPANGDLHLRSAAGRCQNGVWTNDAETSWAIDAGTPTNLYAAEPAPNGSRVNAGQYGNSAEASKSVTNAAGRALLAVTLADGGLVQGVQTLYWLSRGLSSTDLVTLAYSGDNGVTWTNIATHVDASAEGHAWDPSSLPSSPLSRWRVVCEADPGISDTNDIAFVLRNGPITFYVNDDSTNNDIYATATGNSTNTGLTPDAPKALIQQILAYDLEGGDRVLVDTGYYYMTNEIYVSALDGGSSSSRVYFVGSTNPVGDGTVLQAQFTDPDERAVFRLRSAGGVSLSHLILEGGDQGLYLDFGANGNAVSNLWIRGCTTVGIESYASVNNRLSEVLVTDNLGNGYVGRDANGFNAIERSVFWNNRGSAIWLLANSVSVSNSVLSASNESRYCYYVSTSSVVRADYNDLVVTNGASFGYVLGVPIEALPQWNAASTSDIHSISVDPRFYDSTNGDYHLRSEMGRFDPATRAFVTNDTETSLLVDFGSPASAWSNEPAPNGGRINIGLHGNTPEASKSLTNRVIMALTASDGGRLEGILYLAWNALNIDLTNTVSLDYSYDNGANWTNIARNQSITNWSYLWDSAEKYGAVERYPSSPLARWRVVVESDTNLYDVTDSRFALRNRLFMYYVNDADTNGDVYCSAVGSDTNLGIFPYIPKATLRSLLESMDVEGEDQILIDTGVHPITTNDLAVFGAADQGRSNLPVVVRGNTNALLTVLQRVSPEPAYILTVSGGNYDIGDLVLLGGSLAAAGPNLVFRHIVLTNGAFTLTGPNQVAEDIRIDTGWVGVSGSDAALSGFDARDAGLILSGTNIVLANSLIHGSADPAVYVNGVNIVLRNNTLVGSGTQFKQGGFGGSTLQNNIIVADGADKFCIQREGGTLSSDYNDLVARGGAWIGNANLGKWERLLYWQRESGQDLHSMAADPLFGDDLSDEYHLKSVEGRKPPSGWTNDTVHSPCIDAGDPSSDYSNETAPNGSRANLGAYGNTDEASRSRTNAWLTALTMNDGGVIKGTNTLRWLSGNLAGGDLVNLRYSQDNGSSWTTFASGVSATLGEYTWDTTQVTSSLRALWQVVLQTNAAVYDRSDTNFAVRNVPMNFYVNDTSTVDDAWSGAVGSALNDGLTPGAPKNSIQDVLDTYDTEALDTIWVDNGTYPLSSDIRVIWSRGGDNAYGNMMIRGNTNYGAARTLLSRDSTVSGDDIFEVKASHVTLRDFTLRNAYRGAVFETNRYGVAERLTAVSNVVGVAFDTTFNSTGRNLRLLYNVQAGVDIWQARTTLVQNCTFVGNSNASLRMANSVRHMVQNNIFYLGATNSTALGGWTNDIRNAFIDYNVYYFVGTTTSRFFDTYRDLMNWQLTWSNDYRSAVTNPLFVSVAQGDYHLQSAAGRYSNDVWVNDAATSWAIDKGSPDCEYSLEPQTNGNRVNVGAYGGTEFASKGFTNSTVYVRTLNERTYIVESNSLWALIWTVINVPSDEVFRVQYSGDGGTNWNDLATGVRAWQEYYLFQTVPYYNTHKGRWRIVGQGASNYWDVNDAPFDIFYGEFAISNQYMAGNVHGFWWRGAWNEPYQVQYSTNLGATNGLAWWNAPTGTTERQKANFISTNGGDFAFEDVGSSNSRWRVYRVIITP